jgi:hypothetical protein
MAPSGAVSILVMALGVSAVIAQSSPPTFEVVSIKKRDGPQSGFPRYSLASIPTLRVACRRFVRRWRISSGYGWNRFVARWMCSWSIPCSSRPRTRSRGLEGRWRGQSRC